MVEMVEMVEILNMVEMVEIFKMVEMFEILKMVVDTISAHYFCLLFSSGLGQRRGRG